MVSSDGRLLSEQAVWLLHILMTIAVITTLIFEGKSLAKMYTALRFEELAIMLFPNLVSFIQICRCIHRANDLY